MFACLCLLFFCLAIFFATILISRLVAESWQYLPDFVTNSLANRVAVCSVTDHKKAGKIGWWIRNRLVVHDTITFSRDHPDDKYSSGGVQYSSGRPYPNVHLGCWMEDPQLFIPFLSQRHASFFVQEEIFPGPQDLKEWVARKKAENRKADIRFRLADGEFNSLLERLYFLSWGASVVLFFILLFILEHR